MSEDALRRRILTKQDNVPPELLRTLATDGGVEAIKLMLKDDKWDESKPLATIIHTLSPTGSIVSTKWMTWVSISNNIAEETVLYPQGKCCPVGLRAHKIWTDVEDTELFLSINMDSLEQFR